MIWLKRSSHFFTNNIDLLLIIVISLTLRLWGFRIGEVFISSDEAMVALAGLDVTYIFTHLSLYNVGIHILRLLSFGWGYSHILFIFLITHILSFCGFHINEFIIMFPFVIIGTLSCVLIYALTYEIYTNRWIAFIAGILMAIIPLSVSISRSINSSNITSFLLLLTIFLFVKYVKTNKYMYAAPIVLGLYLGNDNQFLGIAPILLSILFLYTNNSITNMLSYVKFFFKKFNFQFISLSSLFFIPSVVSFIYFLTKGKVEGGIIGHTLEKNKTVGFHPEVGLYFIYAVGIMLAVIFLISIIYGLWITFQRKKESFLFVWFLSYSLPWFFLVTPQNDTRVYFIHFIIPLIILSSNMIYDFIQKNKKIISCFVSIIILVTTINTTTYVVHNIQFFDPLIKDKDLINGMLRFYGSTPQKNIGVKTAGYWIRTNTNEKDIIFSEIGFHVSKYYFHRPILANQNVSFSLSYPNVETKYVFFNQSIEDVEYVVTLAENDDIAQEYLNEFSKVVEVQEAGESRLFIYKKVSMSPFIILDTTVYDKLFDQKYGTIESLRTPCYFCYE